MRKARPTTVRIKLCVGRKELRTAGAAEKHALATLGEEAPGTRILRPGLAQDVVALRPEGFAPLGVGLGNFGVHIV